MRALIAILCLVLLPFSAQASQKVGSFSSPYVVNPVWVLPDPSTSLIAMDMTFEGGISLDQDGKEGAVNLLGGVLLTGAGGRNAQELAQFLKDHAISLSISSNRDETIVSLSAPARYWAEASSIIKDVLFMPRFDQGEIDRAKASQIASLKSDLSDPNWRAQRLLNGSVFVGTPYARPGAGNTDSIARLTGDDFRRARGLIFDAKPVHAVFVGRIDQNAIDKFLENFQGLPDPAVASTTPDYRHLIGSSRLFHPFDVPQASLIYALGGISPQDKDFADFTVLNALLGDGFGSRLMSALREQSGLSYGVSSGFSDARKGALWLFSLQVEDQNIARASSILEKEIHATIDKPFTKKEVRDAGESLAAQLPMGWTSSTAIAGELGAAQRNGFGPDYLIEWQYRLRSVTLPDVQNVAKRLLQSSGSVMIAVGRTKPDGWIDKPLLPNMEE